MTVSKPVKKKLPGCSVFIHFSLEELIICPSLRNVTVSQSIQWITGEEPLDSSGGRLTTASYGLKGRSVHLGL